MVGVTGCSWLRGDWICDLTFCSLIRHNFIIPFTAFLRFVVPGENSYSVWIWSTITKIFYLLKSQSYHLQKWRIYSFPRRLPLWAPPNVLRRGWCGTAQTTPRFSLLKRPTPFFGILFLQSTRAITGHTIRRCPTFVGLNWKKERIQWKTAPSPTVLIGIQGTFIERKHGLHSPKGT